MNFGTFDYLHDGHSYFLNESKKYGDFLITVIARDRTVHTVKDFHPKNSEKIRKKNLQKLKIANKVVFGYLKNKYKIIEKYQPDVICLGYDQIEFTKNLKKILKDLHLNTKIVRIKSYHPDKFKSTYLRNHENSTRKHK